RLRAALVHRDGPRGAASRGDREPEGDDLHPRQRADIWIRQGPLQRLLGLADVELRTAGGSETPSEKAGHGSSARNLHLARFRGVDNAGAIRDLVSERMKKARGAGLGDPEDALPPDGGPLALDLAAAARD